MQCFCFDIGFRSSWENYIPFTPAYICFYITLHWRGGRLIVCVSEEPKTFRSQSNKFFSSTEVSVLDEKRYNVYGVHVRLWWCLELPAHRGVAHVLVALRQCMLSLCACQISRSLRRTNVCVYEISLWNYGATFFSFMQARTNWQQCSQL